MMMPPRDLAACRLDAWSARFTAHPYSGCIGDSAGLLQCLSPACPQSSLRD